MDDLEEMVMMEAIRLSLAAEEDRKERKTRMPKEGQEGRERTKESKESGKEEWHFPQGRLPYC